MFDTVLGYFGLDQFWMMVTAVVVGYIFVRAIPFVIVILGYILAGLIYAVGIIAGIGVYLVSQGVKFVKSLGDGEGK